MGEQTILCGMLQAGSLLCFDKLVAEGTDPAYAEKLIQFGWETITESLKFGGITLMMDRPRTRLNCALMRCQSS